MRLPALRQTLTGLILAAGIALAATPAADQLDANGCILIPRLLVALGLESSTSNARRVLEGGGVTLGADRQVIKDPKALVEVHDGLIVRVGKHKIVKVRRSA